MRSYKHKLEYFKDKRRKWRFRFKSRNGNILCSSEAYCSITIARRSATGLIDSIKEKKLIAVTIKD